MFLCTRYGHIPKGTFTVALFLTYSILNLRDSSTSKSKRQVNAFSNIYPTLHHAPKTRYRRWAYKDNLKL